MSETHPRLSQSKRGVGRRTVQLPSYGVFSSALFAFVMISLVFVRSEFFTSHSEGLMVRTLPTFSRVMRSPGDEPIIVTIDEGKHYFVNSKGVAPIALQSALADALSVHFTKVVFVQADREVDFGTVVLAVDAIKGAGAQAVLVSEPPKETK